MAARLRTISDARQRDRVTFSCELLMRDVKRFSGNADCASKHRVYRFARSTWHARDNTVRNAQIPFSHREKTTPLTSPATAKRARRVCTYVSEMPTKNANRQTRRGREENLVVLSVYLAGFASISKHCAYDSGVRIRSHRPTTMSAGNRRRRCVTYTTVMTANTAANPVTVS